MLSRLDTIVCIPTEHSEPNSLFASCSLRWAQRVSKGQSRYVTFSLPCHRIYLLAVVVSDRVLTINES